MAGQIELRGETLAGFLGAEERLGGRANLAIMAGDGAPCPESLRDLKAHRAVVQAVSHPPAAGLPPARL